MGVTYINPYRFAGFTPASLSPMLWLDASDTSTITASSGAVSQWNNKGSLGNFIQSTAAYQPTTGTTTQNGLNVLAFNADLMTSADAASAYKALHDGTDYIIGMVVKVGTSSNTNALNVLFDNCAGSPSFNGFSLFHDDRSAVPRNDRFIHFVARGVSGQLTADNQTADGAFTTNAWRVVSLFADPNNGTASARSAITIDDASPITNNTSTNAPSTSNPLGALKLGTLVGYDSTFQFTGGIAEIVIVSGTNATEANRSSLHGYLKSKWGL